MPANNINDLLQIWLVAVPPDVDPPFNNKDNLYNTINQSSEGDAPWQHFTFLYNGKIPEGDTTPWKHAVFDVWFQDPHIIVHNQLGNPDFAGEMDCAPKEVQDEKGKCRYKDFMSGNWSWQQAVCVF